MVYEHKEDPLKRIILSATFVGLVALALPIEGQKAQAFPVPDALSRVVGAPTATCTPRGCRYKVTCEEPTGEYGCIFGLSLTRKGTYLTRVPVCILDEEGEGECLPKAKLQYLDPGETTTLKLRLLKVGRQEVEHLLKRGKRAIKGGGWETIRADLIGPESEAEAEAWDAVPGFNTYAVLGGWLVFQTDEDTKIRLKR